MKFLADECCDKGSVNALRADGNDVLYVVESMQGSIDELVLKKAYEDERILLTEDKDFGGLVYRLKKPAFGIILLRFSVAERFEKVDRLRQITDLYPDNLVNKFVVLEPDKVRFRNLK